MYPILYILIYILSMDCHLAVVEGLACLSDPESYASRSNSLLVGSPMLVRSKGRGLTKSDPLALQVGGWAQGLATQYHKRNPCYGNSNKLKFQILCCCPTCK